MSGVVLRLNLNLIQLPSVSLALGSVDIDICHEISNKSLRRQARKETQVLVV